MRCRLLVFLLIGGIVAAEDKAEPKTARGWFERGGQQFQQRLYDEAVKSFTKCLELDAGLADAMDMRGSANFMRGKFKESVADFDRYLAMRPDKANGHWRRGIVLYYVGKYEEGKKQFEGYDKVDTNDVENAVWHFICAARKDGVEKARAGILKIGKDGRVPMMEVYDLFQGKCKPEDVLAAANAGTLPEAKRKGQLFFAHLYLGLYYEVMGKEKEAKEHFALASGKYRMLHYMGEVARVHHEWLAGKK